MYDYHNYERLVAFDEQGDAVCSECGKRLNRDGTGAVIVHSHRDAK